MQVVEPNRRYLVIKGGLAWLLWQEGVVITVVVLSGISNGLGVYRRRRGGRNNKYNANISMTVHDKTSNDARRALAWYEVVPVKGGNIRESIPGVLRFRAKELEGESCEFDRLGVCGGRTDCVSGYVTSF